MAKPDKQLTYRQLLPSRFSVPAGIEPSSAVDVLCGYSPIVCRGRGCMLLLTAIPQAPGQGSYFDDKNWRGFKKDTAQAAQDYHCPFSPQMGELLDQLDNPKT